MVSVLLDTDPGSDIDDVLAIAYLLKQPRCEFVGITTVSGDTPKRAALAEMVCRAFGREDIPIVAGWAVTPEDAFIGNAVENAPVTWPAGTNFTVKSGALPDGVALDSATGAVSGTFATPGAFNVTIEIETICGNAEIVWSGDVKEKLADTGFDADDFIVIALPSTLALAAGVFLMVTRKRRLSN